MKLESLSYTENSRKSKTRKGRGIAAGKGKTAGRGMNGQNARSGGGVRPGFEGGQNAWYIRLPKRGFNNINHISYQVVNLATLEKKYQNNETVDLISLLDKNIISKKNQPVKVLGNGKLTKKLTIQVDRISATAREAVVKVGGKVVK